MIPKVFHYVWVGGRIPDRQRAFVQTWHETNPDYEVVCWNEDNIDFTVPLIKRAYKAKQWAKVADIARLMAVAKHGGIYLDCDFRVFKPFDPIMNHHCFFCFQDTDSNSTDLVANGVFGAEPGHWFIEEALQRVLAIRQVPFDIEKPTKYGPKLVTKLLRENGLSGYFADGVMVRDVFVAPRDVFFPFSYGEEFTPACVTDRTLAAHFWHKSWHGTMSVPARIAERGYRFVKLAKKAVTAT